MNIRKTVAERRFGDFIREWRERTCSRRRFLLGLAGGSLATLMPLSVLSSNNTRPAADHWAVLDRVQDHLFPSEDEAPGAREINALRYLQWVVSDKGIDEEERHFILRGVDWLDDLAWERHDTAFLALSSDQQDELLRQVARSDKGENWLATLLLYIMEALLTAPVYGGNPDQIGWRWLRHQPGYPLPDETNRYRGV